MANSMIMRLILPENIRQGEQTPSWKHPDKKSGGNGGEWLFRGWNSLLMWMVAV